MIKGNETDPDEDMIPELLDQKDLLTILLIGLLIFILICLTLLLGLVD